MCLLIRMKSKSFPSLEGFHRQEVKGQPLLLTNPLFNEWAPHSKPSLDLDVLYTMLVKSKPVLSFSRGPGRREGWVMTLLTSLYCDRGFSLHLLVVLE